MATIHPLEWVGLPCAVVHRFEGVPQEDIIAGVHQEGVLLCGADRFEEVHLGVIFVEVLREGDFVAARQDDLIFLTTKGTD